MAFLNSLIFPTDISVGSQGGPRWASEVVVTDSGREYTNNPWSYPLSDFDVGYGVKTIALLEALISTFHVAEAKTNAFRYLDYLDYKSCSIASTPAYDDQTILASATGGETSLQIYKNYAIYGYSLSRKITRPYGTTLLGINGTEKTEGTHFTVDYTTGLIDLTGGSAPYGALSATDSVTWGGTFHVPVRFDINQLPITLITGELGKAGVPLVEKRE